MDGKGEINKLLLGEKLSKQQLQHSNIIKKLRGKEKESDARMTKQQRKIKEQEEELRQLQQVRFFYIFKNGNTCYPAIVK